jgi:hypothetical protein
MKVKTKVRAGGVWENHNATKAGLKIKTKVRAGGVWQNHNGTKR